jgi:cbb3-type cytochrome oxidase subunit 1
MPRLSQWLIRAALLYLLAGFTIGALLLGHKGVPFHPALWSWLPAHIEFLLIGWIMQLTMGVAYWILPRFWDKPRDAHLVYAQTAFVLLNVGIWLVVIGGLWRDGRSLLWLGRAMELGAAVAFARYAWGRVVGREG